MRLHVWVCGLHQSKLFLRVVVTVTLFVHRQILGDTDIEGIGRTILNFIMKRRQTGCP